MARKIDPIKHFPDSRDAVEYCYRALIAFYPDETGLFKPEESWKYPFSEKWHWAEKSDYPSYERLAFARDLLKRTGQSSIREAFGVVNAWHKFYQQSRMDNIPPEIAQPDMPPPEDLKYWTAQGEKAQQVKGDIRQEAHEAVTGFEQKVTEKIEKQKEKTTFQPDLQKTAGESVLEQPSATSPTQPAVKEPDYVYLNAKKDVLPQFVNFTAEQKAQVQKMVDEARENPKNFYEKAAKKAEENLNRIFSETEKEIFEPQDIKNISGYFAYELTKRTLQMPEIIPDRLAIVNPAESIAALTLPQANPVFGNQIVSQALADTARMLIESNNQTVVVAHAMFGQDTDYAPLAGSVFRNISEKESAEKFETATKKTQQSIYQIQLQKIKNFAETRYQLIGILKNKYPEANLSDKEINQLVNQVSHFNQALGYFGYLPQKKFAGQSVNLAGPSSQDAVSMLQLIGGKYQFGLNLIIEGEKPVLKMAFNFGGRTISLGNFSGRLAEKLATSQALIATKGAAVKTGVSKAVSAFIVKMAAKTGLKTLIAAMGSFAPIIGNIIGWIAGELLWRLGVWIKKHWKEIGLALAGIGLLMQMPSLIALGLAITLLAAGVGTVVGTTAGVIGFFWGALTSVLVGIATTVVVLIFSIPILVALILFIINTGAYLYPPGEKLSSGGGNIVLGCYKLVDDVDPWTGTPFDNVTAAIAKLESDHPPFVTKVCGSGEVLLHYSNTDPGYWGHYDGTNNITLYSGGLTNTLDAEYILAHESSHLMAAYSFPIAFHQYQDYPGTADERPICSYLATTIPSEAFSESNALYASEKPFSCFGGSFQSRYPRHWQFSNDIVFR